jgi:hypothetical protein
MNKVTLEEIIESDDQGLLRDSYTSNKERVTNLIKAQDLIRQVFCSESGQAYIALKKIDKELTNAINQYK